MEGETDARQGLLRASQNVIRSQRSHQSSISVDIYPRKSPPASYNLMLESL